MYLLTARSNMKKCSGPTCMAPWRVGPQLVGAWCAQCCSQTVLQCCCCLLCGVLHALGPRSCPIWVWLADWWRCFLHGCCKLLQLR